MRRFLRVIKWVGLGLGSVVFLALLASLLLLYTRFGNNRLRVWGLAQVQSMFCGPVALQELRISGWFSIEALGIKIHDCKGRPAFAAERAQVRLSPWPHWKNKIFFVSDLEVEGGQVWVFQEETGSWNWTSLLKEARPSTPATPAKWTWQVERVQVQAMVQVQPQKVFSPTAWKGRIQIQGRLLKTPRSLVWKDGDVSLDVEHPHPIHVRLRGGGSGSDGNLLDAALHFRSPGLELEVHADASLLQRWVPLLDGKGPVSLKGSWKGGLFHSTFELDVLSSALHLHGEGGTDLQGLAWGWRAKLQSQDIQTKQLGSQLPVGKGSLQVEAHGSWSEAHITLDSLSWQGEGSSLKCHGEAHWKEGMWSHAEVHAQAVVAQAGSLSPLVPAGWRGQGSAQLDALYRGTWNLQGQLQGQGIRGPEVAVGDIQIRLDTHASDIVVSTLRNARVGDFGFVRLQAKAQKQKAGVTVEVQGEGLHGVGLGLKAQVMPQRLERPWEVVEIVVPQFFLRRLGQQWSLLHPAFIELRTGENSGFRIRDFLLSFEKQRVSLEGAYTSQGDEMDLQVDFQRLDVRKVAQFFYPRAILPTTNFHFHTHLHGSLLHPKGTLELRGNSRYFEALHWQPATYLVTATVGEGRIRGSASAQTQGTGRTSLHGNFSLPFSTHRPLQLDVAGKIPLALLRPLLPDDWDGVTGSIAMNLRCRGTLQRPSVEVSLKPDSTAEQKIGASAWALQGVAGESPFVSLQYDGDVVRIESVGSLWDSTHQPLGTWRLEGVQIPLSWEALVWKRRKTMDWLQMPFAGRAQVEHIRGSTLMRVLQQTDAPLQDGVFNASLQLGGTWQKPDLRLSAHAEHVRWRNNPTWDTGADIQLTYTQNQLQAHLQGWLQGHALLKGTAETRWALADFLDPPKNAGWRVQPIKAEIVVQETFPWHTLLPVQGQFGAKIHLQGSLTQPQWFVEANGQQVAWEGGTLGTVSMKAFPRDAQSLTADISIVQPGGGSLQAQALIPWPFVWKQAALDVQAHRFSVSYQVPRSEKDQPLQTLAGDIDANAHIHWKFGRPQVTGSFHVQKGSLGLNTSTRYYRDLQLDMDIKPTENPQQVDVVIESLTGTVGSGRVTLSGIARMEGWKTVRAELLLGQKRFPLSQGTLGAWLDADTRIHAETEGTQLRVSVNPISARVQLPSLDSGGQLHPLTMDENVGFVDRTEEKKEETSFRDSPLFQLLALYTLPERTHVELVLSEPIPLEGPRLEAKVTGALTLEVAPDQPVAVDGSLRSVRGTVQLFGKSYDIRQGEVRLNGPVSLLDPKLFVQLTRPVPQATLTVEASGTLSRPITTLRTDPPLYTQAQLLTMFAGVDSVEEVKQPGQQGRDAVGLLAGLVLAQARQVAEQRVDDQTSKALQVLLPDTLKVDTDPNSDDLVQNSRVEVGKSLIFPDAPQWSNLVYIGFSYQPGVPQSTQRKQNTQQVNVDLRFLRNVDLSPRWLFLRNLQFRGTYGNENVASFSISLHWRLPVDKKPEEPNASLSNTPANRPKKSPSGTLQ